MSLRNRLVLPVVLSTLALLVGCGSSTNNPVAPPSGAFTNTDFSGTYTFSVSGADDNGAFMMAGSLTACGCTAGTISGGTVDYDDPSVIAPASTVGSGTYNVTADGRGTAIISVTVAGTATQVELAFVLTSSSHGLIIRYDGAGTGSGTIDLQPSVIAESAIVNTPYAFSLSGNFDGASFATAGAFTLNSLGEVSAGVEDFNDNGVPNNVSSSPYTITSGSVSVGSGTTPGVATLTSGFGTITFDVYTVDATHLKLIESDGIAFLVGDVFTQTSATIPQGNLVFAMAGLDTSGNEFAVGGLMASDGSSQLTGGSEDINDDGIVDNSTVPAVPFNFSGNFSTLGSGRFLINLTGFAGGTSFAAYPSSGGILMLEVDTGLNVGAGNIGVTSGMALAQASGATVSASQGYGLNNSGEDVNNGVELDEIAQFTTTSTGVSGLLDENDFGIGQAVNNVGGTYTVNSNGTGSATIGKGLPEIFFYAADSSTVLFISADPNGSQASLGVFEAQTAPGGAASAARPRVLPMFRTMPHSRSAVRHGNDKTRVLPAKQL